MSQYLGDISAYALAVSQGYTGTEEEYAELMASYATVGQTAVTAAQTATTKASEAATSATTATNKASEATTAATTATTKAGEASTSASTATSAKDTAVSASQTATTKATEATTAAATAVSAKDDAVSANTAAQSAKTAAQTAQTGAETAAASVQSSAAQIATNAEDISQLKSELSDITDTYYPCIIDMDTSFLNGYLDSSGNFVATSNTQWTTDFVECEKNVPYKCDINLTLADDSTQTYPRALFVYNTDKTLSRKLTLPSDLVFTLTDGEKYIRLNYNARTLNSLAVYQAKNGDETVISVDGLSEVESKDTNYCHARRSIIAFILDGDYDLNPTMEAIFANHGYRIGFAPQYPTFGYDYIGPNKVKYQNYLDWQKKGHEILSHLNYSMSDSSTYTDAQIIGFIAESYTVMTGCGFPCHGAIGSGGKVADRFVPYIKKYYDYAATEGNHYGSSTPCLAFATDNPYHLWRYSMQTSTLAEQKNAVDDCIANVGLLMFYGHALSSNDDYFTAENLEELLTYIDGKVANNDCKVMTPYKAISDFYSIRHDDLISQTGRNTAQRH